MASSFRGHKLAALIVLVAAGAWVATGEFSSVGGEEAAAATAPPEAAPAPSPAESAPRTVGVIEPSFFDHAREIRVSASTGADKSAVLAARSNGVVSALPITEGAEVAAGDVVMTLEGAEMRAAVLTAQAALDQASREREVAERLFSSGTAPELQLIRARATEAAARAALTEAEAAADRLNLRAPFAGVADTVDVELGEWVQVGTPIATLISLDPIIVRAEVSELDVGAIALGATASVRLVSGETLEGAVTDIGRAARPETRTFPVEVSLPNPDRSIPVGMTAEVSLFAAPVRAVTVPRSVITLSDSGELGLRVVGADGTAGFAPVTIVDDTPQGLIVTGVPQGIRIVVLGQDLVKDGDRVTAVPVPPGMSGGAAP
jgi:membrane fusion protein, multidrug efflux system